MKLNDKIKVAREAKEWTQDDLAKASGVPLPSIKRYESTSDNNITLNNLHKIAKALEYDLTYFLDSDIKSHPNEKQYIMEEKDFKALVEEMKSFFGVGSIEKVAEKLGKSRATGTTWRGRKTIPSDVLLEYYKLKSQAGLEPSYQSFKSKTPNITYYPNIKASAGYGIINENEESVEIDTNLLDAIKMPHKKLDMIQVQGDSMHPYIQNGDFALIERSNEARNGDVVIANYQGDLYVKQIQKNPQKKSISLISANKDYPSFEIRGDEIDALKLIGILRGVIRIY